MRIDAHHHLWRPTRGDYGWLTPDMGELYRDFDPAMLRPLLDAARIEATIVVQAAPTENETRWLLDIASSTPWIVGVVGWTDLSAPDASERIAGLAGRGGLVGLRPMLQDLEDPAWIGRADVQPGLAAMAEHALVFDALVRQDQIQFVSQIAETHPGLTIVLDHAGKPRIGQDLSAWRRDVRRLASFPNVHVKLSGLLTEAPAGALAHDLRPCFDTLLDHYGPERILWGSDWPVLTLAASYMAWISVTSVLIATLNDAERAAIMGENAARLYRIKRD